jgi:hypothetical protein
LLLGHAHFGKQNPANAVELRQADGAAKAVREHIPQPLLEGFGVHGFDHFVLADDQMAGQCVTQTRASNCLRVMRVKTTPWPQGKASLPW